MTGSPRLAAVTAWPAPDVPELPGRGPDVRITDSSSGRLVEPATGDTAGLYVCGITPYDATHMGHAATYVTFDLLNRAWRDSGRSVTYVQNVTDVDDPLLERAERDGVDWRDLAAREVALFGEDMTALRVLPPQDYVGVVESIPKIAAAVAQLVDQDLAYYVPVPDSHGRADVYLDLSAEPRFGQVSGWSREQMLQVFAERGGDPDRVGKRDPLDPLLWRAERDGEPSWDGGSVGPGRPGWHIECTSISLDHLGMGFDVQGGGTDLVFPHHEMSAVQAGALTGEWPFANAFVHQAMVGLDGEKMSKSKGNLVKVSVLRGEGVDPMAIRLTLLQHHYATPWSWTQADLDREVARLERWRAAVAAPSGTDAGPTLAAARSAMADNLDSPAAIAAIDEWVAAQQDSTGAVAQVADAPDLIRRTADALLGIAL
jgi:L-cysteine:1D-myo-inositol 2-amino-2-deoxy-alpha-D-glucopyranoside ligase